LLGKTQELASIKKDREDYNHRLDGLDYQEALAQYVIKKVNQELEELGWGLMMFNINFIDEHKHHSRVWCTHLRQLVAWHAGQVL